MDKTELDETLLNVCQPSEMARRDARLRDAGVAETELDRAKAAVAALGLAVTEGGKPSKSLKDRLLSSMSRKGRFGVFADRLARMFDLTVDEAEGLVAKLEDPSAWTPFFIPGVEMINVQTGPRLAGAIAVIAKLQPGAQFPDHIHRGNETMFVLAGGFRETKDGGAEVWRGDELSSFDGSDHAFVALPGEPCITASLVEGIAEFK